MELLLTGMAMQVLALGLLAFVALSGDAGREILLKLRTDGRTEQTTRDPDDRVRLLVVRGLLGLFAGGTLMALTGMPRL